MRATVTQSLIYVCASDCDDFHVRLDLANEALDTGERSGERARAASARTLVMNGELVAGEPEDVQIAAVALEVRPHLLVEDRVDLVEALAVGIAQLFHFRHRLRRNLRGLFVSRRRLPY